MIIPTKQEDIANWAPILGIARQSCSRLLSIMNTHRPDGHYGLFELNGIRLLQQVIGTWAPDPHRGSKIAVRLWSHEWQVIWDQSGLFVDGDIEAFDRDLTFIAMVDAEEIESAASCVKISITEG